MGFIGNRPTVVRKTARVTPCVYALSPPPGSSVGCGGRWAAARPSKRPGAAAGRPCVIIISPPGIHHRRRRLRRAATLPNVRWTLATLPSVVRRWRIWRARRSFISRTRAMQTPRPRRPNTRGSRPTLCHCHYTARRRRHFERSGKSDSPLTGATWLVRQTSETNAKLYRVTVVRTRLYERDSMKKIHVRLSVRRGPRFEGGGG